MHGNLHYLKNSLVENLSKVGFALGVGFKKSPPTLRYEIERRAIEQSADYVQEKMGEAVIFNSHDEILRFAVARARLDGIFLEFGVYSGQTINKIAKHLKQLGCSERVYGFDSFYGLPEDWSGYVITKETFDRKGELPKVMPNVELVEGFFDESLPKWIKSKTNSIDRISLLHIDSDLYSSCRCILTNLACFIKPDTFVLFDEYFNYPGWKNHEFKAFKEFCSSNSVKYEYVGFFEQKVLVRIV